MTKAQPNNSTAVIAAIATIWLAALPAQAADTADAAAAKSEGSVVWYSSTPIEQANKIIKLFEAKHGIKVELFRSGGSEILRRFLQEQQAGRILADVLTASDPEALADLAESGALIPFKPADAQNIPAELQDKQGRYIAQRLNVVSFYGRTDQVAPEAMPKSWSDLASSQFKGKLVMTDPSFTVLQLYVVGTLSKELGWDYYKKISANDAMIVKGGQQTFDAVRRGERAVAGGSDISYAMAGATAGFPVKVSYPSDGAFVIPAPTGVVKGSPHPNAAKLLAEFMLSKEAQQVFPESGNYGARLDTPPPADSPSLREMKIKPIDYEHVKKNNRAIKKSFSEIFQ